MSVLWTIESFDPDKPLPHEGEVIDLLTPEEFQRLPMGTILLSIFGRETIKGRDIIDDDMRAGHLAFGIPVGNQ